ncbi:hypothetical protein ACP70R_015094 [Stipagrostis hirtigluma subsp. patula]
MAATLRSAIGRAARRAASSDLLTRLRGPRPRPRPRRRPAPPSAEVDLLAKKVNDAGKKDRVRDLAESLVEEQKKKYRSRDEDLMGLPLFTAISLAVLFVSGCELGRDHRSQVDATCNKKNAARR